MMATVRWTSELMTNVVAAVPVAGNTRFATCLDSLGQRPAIFGISNHPIAQLTLIQETHDGVRKRQNFGKLLGISETAAVQAFDVRQGADLNIYLVVATKHSDTHSSILVTKPFQLTAEPMPMLAPVEQLPTVFQIFLGTPLASGQYSSVILTHQRMDRLSKSSDIVQLDVQVDKQKISWSVSEELHLPANVDKILDIAPVYSDTLRKARGVCALCNVQGKTKLIATYVWGQAGSRRFRDCEILCEQGATSIASYADSVDGSSALIVGGPAGLWNFTSDELVASGSSGKLVHSDALFKGARRLVIAQNGADLSVFLNNKDRAIAYVMSNMETFQEGNDKGYYLTTQGSSSDFSATIIHPAGEHDTSQTVHSLMSVDDSGNLSLLEQNTDTGIWKTEPYYVSNLDEVLDIQSYSISVETFLANGKQAAGGSAFVQSSTSTVAIVNGKQSTILSTGQWLPLDEMGELAIILATEGIVAPVFTISQVKDVDGAILKLQSVIMNPSSSVINKLAAVPDLGLALQAASRKFGQPEKRLAEPDLDAAVAAFKNLAAALKDVPADGSIKIPSNFDDIDIDIGEWFMDGWNWVKDNATDAKNWIVEQAGDFWRFSCSIGNDTKRFVLNCVEKIAEGALWVWSKVEGGWDFLCELVGFLFEWSDIVATKNTLASFFGAALDLTADKIDGVDKKVDDWISGLQSKIDDRKDANPAAISTKAVNETQGSSVDAQRSSQFKWAFERVRNGGKGSDTMVKSAPSSMEPNDQTWKSVFEPLLDSIVQLGRDTADDICQLFKDFDSFTTGDLWAKLGKDFLFNVLEVIKKMIHAILGSVSKLIRLFKQVLTGETRIPILSKLFERHFGQPASLFNILCFIIAIPTTVLTKAMIKRAPPTFPDINTSLLDGILGFSDNPLVTAQTKLDFATFSAGVTTSIVFWKGLYQTIRLAYSYVSGDTGTVIAFLTPGMVMKVITIILDVVGVIHTFPTTDTVPGYELRLAASILGVVRCVGNVLLITTPLGKTGSEEKNLVLDALTCIVNWGLYEAVFFYEYEDTKWVDHDKDVSSVNIVASTMNLIAGMGKFIAFVAKAEPPVSAAGAIAMNVANWGAFVSDGVVFSKTNAKKRAALLVTPAV